MRTKIALITLFTFLSSMVFAHGDKVHSNTNSKAKTMIENGETYHKNVSMIRKMHPVFMKHKRDATLRQGIRNGEASLKTCVNCHGGFDEKGEAVRIDKTGEFCSDCHQKVAVSVDCFSCHKATSSVGDK